MSGTTLSRGLSGVLSALTILLVAGCATRDEQPSRNRIVVVLQGNPHTLDPRFAIDAYANRVLPLICPKLLDQNPRGDIVPGLAESWEIASGGKEYILTLREGVRFHDGTALRAEDVKYTFSFIMDPRNKAPSSYAFTMVEDIETPDAHTVVFRLKHPFSPFLLKLAKGVVPEGYARNVGERFAERPIGAGPFRFETYEPGARILLRAFDDYWEGRPFLDEIELKIVTNTTTRMLALRKGAVDLVQNSLPPYSIKFFEREAGVEIIRMPGVNFAYIGFNLDDPITGRRAVRQAIAHAIDRDEIIRVSLKGMARPATGLLAPMLWCYEPAVEIYGYDPEKAKALLDEAGFADPDGPGPLPRFTISYKTSTDKLRNEIAEIMKEQLRQVGIGVEKRAYEWGTFFSDVKSGNFQMYTLMWVGVADPDHLYYVFHSSMAPPNGANRGRYRNPKVDGLLERSRTVVDRETLRKIYGEIQRILAHDLVYVPLWYEDNVVAIRSRFKGYTPYLGGEFLSLKDVRIVGPPRKFH